VNVILYFVFNVFDGDVMENSKLKVNMPAAFSAIRQRFEQSLAQRVIGLQQIQTVADVKALSLLPDIIRETHKLAGACGTFGFATLGTMARQIEQLASAIRNKPVAEQLHTLTELKRLLQEFDSAVSVVLNSADATPAEQMLPLPESNSVWLLLDNMPLTAELTAQLTAFGHEVEQFTNFDACLKKLQFDAPKLLFSATQLSNGNALFKQKLLLDLLIKKHISLMVFSEVDNFELRIQASQHRAREFFISPLDVPNMLTASSELLEQCTGKSGRVFIVDDDRLLAEHYALVLNSVGIETQIIGRIRNIIDELTRFQPDLILMDMYMPEFSGAEVADLIRQYKSLKRLPIVFLSSETNKTLQIRAMAHGADDFITKPIDDIQLIQAIKIRLARSIQIKSLIEKDSLTSLIKHSAIKAAADLEYERSERVNTPLSVVMLDIDHFKNVNDKYGHAVGDLVITSLATLLRKRIRKTDRAGRYGGEEFMLVLPECSATQSRLLVKKILTAFASLQFQVNDAPFSCTFSAGVACTGDNRFTSSAQLINAADDALYRAKHAGRNQVC
jgi:diguanylate cyclase (GGDEF)-like protein